ncbi:MAG: hypothetical protein PHU49_04250 [Syntrophorhabdaceae bacterium]|nr:hypothetical protein [Syntrophorhabdaceae bacterium]MDD5243207.1 hypothetical protein [Syntrophorhabdaceae bacterium]
MSDKEKFNALQLIRDAKKEVNEAIQSASGDRKKALEKLSNCFENIEGDLIASALDDKIAQLQRYKTQLESVNSEIEKDMKELKAVADKVAVAAEALGKLIDVIGKLTNLP